MLRARSDALLGAIGQGEGAAAMARKTGLSQYSVPSPDGAGSAGNPESAQAGVSGVGLFFVRLHPA